MEYFSVYFKAIFGNVMRNHQYGGFEKYVVEGQYILFYSY